MAAVNFLRGYSQGVPKRVLFNLHTIKCQIFVLNLIMPKTKWEGAEDPTINNSFKIESRKYAL